MLKIGEKRHSLTNRKYCIKCSPFKVHNTRRLHALGYDVETRNCTCTECGNSYIYNGKSQRSKKICAACRLTRRRRTLKERAVALLGGKCTICEYDRCTSCLCFHHKDSSQKDFAVAGNWYKSWEKISVELDKCVLLCVRCHGELHAGMISLP